MSNKLELIAKNIHAEQEKKSFVFSQFKEAGGHYGQSVQKVTCQCGCYLRVHMAYRCLYCGEFYCQTCAERHFGKTRQQYNIEKNANKEQS